LVGSGCPRKSVAGCTRTARFRSAKMLSDATGQNCRYTQTVCASQIDFRSLLRRNSYLPENGRERLQSATNRCGVYSLTSCRCVVYASDGGPMRLSMEFFAGPEMCWMGGCGYGKLRTCLPPTHTVTETHTYGVERRSHIQIHSRDNFWNIHVGS